MLNEREVKISNLKLQLNSLHNELNATNQTVEERHLVRDNLLKEIEELNSQKININIELVKTKRSNAEEENRHEKKIIKLENEYRDKLVESQKVIESIVSVLVNSELKKISLKDSIDRLNKDKERLNVLRSELSIMENKKIELDDASSVLNQVNNALKEKSEELKTKSEEVKTLKEFQRKSRLDNEKRLNSAKTKTKSALSSAKQLEKNWYRKNKDLLIVEGRLKRKWKVLNPNLPFPKI